MLIEPRELEGMVAAIAHKYGLFHTNGSTQEALNNSFKVLNQVVINCERAGDMRYGIITKPNGTNAFGYSADNIAFKDGSNHFDVIGNADAEDTNNDGIRESQTASFGENGPISSMRVVGPRYDMALDNTQPNPSPQPPNNPPENPTTIEQKLDTLIELNTDILRFQKNILERLVDWHNNGIPVEINANDFPSYTGRTKAFGGELILNPIKIKE